MSRVDAAAAMDRLPWLPDEPSKRAPRRRGALLGWSGAAIALASAVGLWIGVTSIDQAVPPTTQHAQPKTTIRLPEARPAAPAPIRLPEQREVNLTPAPQVRSALRLCHDLELESASAPLVLSLLERIHHLEERLRELSAKMGTP